MNAFDAVELEPITGPVPPEPDADLWPIVYWGLGGVLVLVLVALLVTLIRRVLRHGGLARQPRSVRIMRRLWKARKTANADPSVAELDQLWTVMQDYLIEVGHVGEPAPTLEAVQAALETLDASAGFDSVRLRELIPLVEQTKYLGISEPSDRIAIRDTILDRYREIIAHHR